MNLQNVFSEPAVVATGWALLHLLWQGAIVSVIVGVLLRLFRDSSASLRYALACGGLLLMVIMPFATAIHVYEAAPVRAAVPVSFAAGSTSLQHLLESSDGSSLGWRGWAGTLVRPLVPWTFAFWSAGVLLLSLRLVAGWLRLQRLVRLASGGSEHLTTAVRRLSARMSLSRRVRVAVSEAFDVPVVVGFVRPVLLFPLSAVSGLSPEQLETIAAHELAHIRRHDYLVNLLQTFVEVLFFYHPSVWWLSARIRAEREHCCDDIVVATCGDAVMYARALTELEGLRSDSPRFAMAATGGSLRERVVRLVCATERRASSHRLVTGLAIGVTVVAIFVATPISLLARTRRTPVAAPAPVSGTSLTVVAAPVVAAPRVAAAVEPEVAVTPEVPAVPAVPSRELIEETVAAAVGEAVKAGMTPVAFARQREEIAAARAPRARTREDRDDVFREDGKLSIEELVRLRATGVTAKYEEELRGAGYDNLSLAQLSMMSAVDVDADFIRQMNSAGLGRLSPEELVQARANDVTPEYVKWARSRFGNLPLAEIVPLAANDVDADYVAFTEKNFGRLTPQEIIGLSARGVDQDFLDDMAQAGYAHLSVTDAGKLALSGVDGDYVDSLREAGLTGLSVDELARMKAVGVDGDYVRDLGKLKAKQKTKVKSE